MNRFGYKAGVIAGLSLFSLGSIMFWPCAVAETYAGFLVCTFVVGSGLATLEVAANSYVCVLAGQKHASMALTFAQGFNGISAFAGPLIASKAFFTGANLTSFGGVQWTYLAIGCFGIFLIVLFVVVKFPEVRQDTLPEDDAFLKANGYRGLFRRKRLVFGFVAASRCGVVSSNVTAAEAAHLFSYCQMTFMAGRFLSLPLLHYFYPPAILGIYGTGCFLFAMLTSQIAGNGGTACLFLLFWFESICYPVIFSQATMGLGPYAKAGGALIAMGVSGGAWFPSVQATVADARTTQLSYVVAGVGYVAVAAYGFALWIDSCRSNGFHFRALRVEEDATLHPVMASTKAPGSPYLEKGGIDHFEESVGVNPLALVDPPVAFDVHRRVT
ncbi:hypothetical protein RQP46_006082 [Phenoliferia psychrophenolica]